MNDWINRIERLDLSLFSSIPSQTTDGDRRSLLAVQRATAKCYGEYTYLEIGSYLGGSIQPHLVDDRCKKIYSIDPRPSQQPDDRTPGYIATYEDNSTDKMIKLLAGLGYGELSKIECFNLDASRVDPAAIKTRPQLIFIDGEHTKRAVLSDFAFCGKVVDDTGTILFHDFSKVYRGVLEICRGLDQQNRRHRAVKLDGDVFAIFFNPDQMLADKYLVDLATRNRFFWPMFHLRQWLKQVLPDPLLRLIRGMRT